MDLVFVADTCNHRIRSFRGDGTPVKQWGVEGEADGQFIDPYGVAIFARSQDRDHPTRHRIFVTDCNNHRIQVFNLDGDFICKWGSKGEADGQFIIPHGVAVLARSQDRVLARSKDGILARSQDGNLQNHPIQDLVFIADTCNYRVQVFGLDGTFVRKWSIRDSNGQPCSLSGVAVHPTRDLIFVSDWFGDRIHAFRSDGTFLHKWGSRGSADGQFSYPRSLALHPTRDLLLVVDADNYRVQVFDLNGVFVCKWGSQCTWGTRGEKDGKFFCLISIGIHPISDVVYVGDNSHIQAFSLFHNTRKRKRIIAEVNAPRDSSES